MKILVVSMTTWGEMGNWLSGKSLAATLQHAIPNASTRILAAESVVPAFAETGKAIKQATLESRSTAERFARYSAVLRGLESTLPPGFEQNPPEPLLRDLCTAITEDPPDVLIGTKGVICRALLGALKIAGLERPVLNYVTNHGHFQFPVHRCNTAALHLVRFREGGEYLERECGWEADSIVPVGYLIAARQLGDVRPPDDRKSPAGRQSIIVVSNRGDEEYIELLRSLVSLGDTVHVHFIGINDEPLCARAEELIEANGLRHWRTVSQLDQAEFFRLLLEARSHGTCSLVCKASPNSIFEGIYFGLPLFLIRTGLPMEEWGAELVVREQLGYVEDNVSALAAHLLESLSDPALIAELQGRQRRFASVYLNQEECIRKLRLAIENVSPHPVQATTQETDT